MAAVDLCSLSDIKAWLGVSNSTSDAVLSGLITAASLTILGYLNRTILPAVRTETRDGSGTRRIVLSDWPVISVAGLTVGNSAIQASSSPPFGSGYLLDQVSGPPPGRMQALTMASGLFWSGMSNVSVTYTAGYQISAEAQTIPATPFKITSLNPYGNWASDQGVTFADGTPLVSVASAPATGQYSVALGVYTFAAADSGKVVMISYGYVPADLRQACLEAASERFKYKDRIGINSQSLAGNETISYTRADLSNPVKMMLAPYQRVVQP